MKHPGIYYLYYAAGWAFIAVMAVAIYQLIGVWLRASSF